MFGCWWTWVKGLFELVEVCLTIIGFSSFFAVIKATLLIQRWYRRYLARNEMKRRYIVQYYMVFACLHYLFLIYRLCFLFPHYFSCTTFCWMNNKWCLVHLLHTLLHSWITMYQKSIHRLYWFTLFFPAKLMISLMYLEIFHKLHAFFWLFYNLLSKYCIQNYNWMINWKYKFQVHLDDFPEHRICWRTREYAGYYKLKKFKFIIFP